MVAGDHLQVARQHGLFQHHGIDLGDGTVAHYLEGREILRSPMNEFAGGEVIQIVDHDEAVSAGVTLRRAMSRIGEQKYNLLFNNCEHFANWCKTGRHRSVQLENLSQKSILGAKALGNAIPDLLWKGLNLLLQKKSLDLDSKKIAQKRLTELINIQTILLKKLEQILEEIEENKTSSPNTRLKKSKEINSSPLLVKGQIIADELTKLKNLEEGINILLAKSNNQI
ncbi:lecithin retinol acyltransferase family protein [Prochlorococcus sp. MIT 1300]|uniref:lecithin retinol acyltransferase family protein n=1 Tax=Prochlorococcus sp. MIT 1300 TaxID=3096218 RepID=UPI002A75E077|nr:lecithin retinol acyltransferase family protein [Prochlorococcus sp. MIT 1300]